MIKTVISCIPTDDLVNKWYCCTTRFLCKRGNNLFCVSTGPLQFGLLPLPRSSYLTILHSITEERVQQQVLQLSVSVKRLFDFTQEDTGGEEKEEITGHFIR